MPSTIYVTLQGGLANQACQYAAATKMARATGRKVVCDLSFLNAHQDPNAGITPRQFTLNTLLTEPAETVDQTPPGVIPLSGEVESVPDDGRDYRIQGYWQRLSALPDYRELRGMFLTPATESDLVCHCDYLSLLGNYHNCLGIHVRRADYLTPNALAFHGVLGMDYYQAATQLLLARNGLQASDTQLVVYSDDTAWCKSDLVPHLGFDNVIYAEDYLDGDAVQLYSMAFLHHFVIANSSFSWLGRLRAIGYGNTSTVMPSRWFRGYSPPDMCPPTWVKV